MEDEKHGLEKNDTRCILIQIGKDLSCLICQKKEKEGKWGRENVLIESGRRARGGGENFALYSRDSIIYMKYMFKKIAYKEVNKVVLVIQIIIK